MEHLDKEDALQILKQDAEKIFALINSQKEHICFADCPAFEEIIDTQMYGFSKEVDFAVRLGILKKEAGNRLLSDLETSLNVMYNNYYTQQVKDNAVKGDSLP